MGQDLLDLVRSVQTNYSSSADLGLVDPGRACFPPAFPIYQTLLLASCVVTLCESNRKIVQIPLELGLSSKLLWTAGPMSPPRVGVPAVPHLDAQALLNWLTPMELRFSDVLFVPSVNYLPATGAPSVVPSRGAHFLAFLLRVVSSTRPPLPPYPLGRVGLKDEPAGKSRLFMMLDNTTQRLLHPIHRWVFAVLRLIPMVLFIS